MQYDYIILCVINYREQVYMARNRFNSKLNIKCEGILKCEAIEPVIAYFFGSVDPTKKEVPVEFIVSNVDLGLSGNQYLTLTKVNGVNTDIRVPFSSKTYGSHVGNVDIWDTVDKDEIKLRFMVGLENFYITHITK